MKILFLTDNFPPEVNAPATRTYEHCIEWKNKGADITVITCNPNFPQGVLYEGYQNKLVKKEIIDGIRVIRVWSYIAPNKRFLRRVLDYLSYAFMAFWIGLFVKTDIIIATSPQFFTAVTGRFLALLKQKPWIMEVRDLWPESINAVDAIEAPFIIKQLEKLELYLYRSATKIVVVTDAFKSNMVSRGIVPDKIHVIKNGVKLSQFYPLDHKDEQLVKQLNIKDKIVVGYIGTHGMAHRLSFILQCAKDVNSNQVHFLFIGDGAEKKKLLALKEQEKLTNVTFLPPVSKNEISSYIGVTDIALVCLLKSDTFKTVIPSKIFENAAMKKPILLGVEGEAAEIIQKYDAGLCYVPENKADFLKQLNALVTNQELYQQKQLGCVKLAHDFQRENLANQMLAIIRDCVE
jgi:glycosyltransferase involved in cell wall biosynthesis